MIAAAMRIIHAKCPNALVYGYGTGRLTSHRDRKCAVRIRHRNAMHGTPARATRCGCDGCVSLTLQRLHLHGRKFHYRTAVKPAAVEKRVTKQPPHSHAPTAPPCRKNMHCRVMRAALGWP